MRDWKPGDVALMKYHGEKPTVAVRVTDDTGDHWHTARDTTASGALAEWVRPLVVIDPDDDEQVRRLVDALFVNGAPLSTYHDVRQALRSLIAIDDPIAHRTVDGLCPACLKTDADDWENTSTGLARMRAARDEIWPHAIDDDQFPDLLGDLAHEIRRLVANLIRKTLRR